MRKHFFILLLIFVICMFGQSDVSCDFVSAIIPGYYIDAKTSDSLLLVNRSNMVEIHKLDTDTLEFISRVKACNVIETYDISNSFLTISTKYNSRYFVYDISDLYSPELIISSEFEDGNFCSFGNDYQTLFFLEDDEEYCFLKLNSENNFDTCYTNSSLYNFSMNNNNVMVAQYSYEDLVVMDFSDFNAPETIAVLNANENYILNDTLLITSNNEISIYNFDDSNNISLTRTLPSRYDVRKIWNNYLFLTNIPTLYKYELTPTDFTLVNSVRVGNYYYFYDSVFVEDNQIYDYNTMEEVCDFSSPIFDELTEHYGDLYYIIQDFVILISSYIHFETSRYENIGMVVYNNTDYDNPEIISIHDKPGNYYPLQYSDSILISVNSERTMFEVNDLTDLDNITSSTYEMEYPFDTLFLHENHAVLSNGDDGFRVLSLRPSIEMGYENTDFICEDVTFSDEYAIISGLEDGVLILDLETMDEICSMTFDGYVYGAIIYDNYLYLGMGYGGMKMFDISDIDNPIEHLYTVGHKPRKLFLVDNNMFINGTDLYNYDLSVPHIPVLMDIYEDYGYMDQFIFEKELVESGHYYGDYYILHFFNLDNPDSPLSTFSLEVDDYFIDNSLGLPLNAKDNVLILQTVMVENLRSRVYYLYPSGRTHGVVTLPMNANLSLISGNSLFSYSSSGIDLFDISSFNN